MKFLNQRGFTLAQVVVAAGLLGGLSLVVMNLSKQQSDITKRANESQSIMFFQDAVMTTLANTTLCTDAITNPGVGQIKDKTSTDLTAFGEFLQDSYIDGQTKSDSSSKIRIVGFKIIKNSESQTLLDGEKNALKLRVHLMRESSRYKTPRPLFKDINFSAIVTAGVATSCSTLESSSIESGIVEATKNICDGFGGRMVDGQCDMSARITQIKEEAIIEAINRITTNETINATVANSMCNDFGGTLVNGQCQLAVAAAETAPQEEEELPSSVTVAGSSCPSGYSIASRTWVPETCGSNIYACTTASFKTGSSAPTCSYRRGARDFKGRTCTATTVINTTCNKS